MEILVVIALMGLLAGGTLWTARQAVSHRDAAAAEAALVRLDRDARRLLPITADRLLPLGSARAPEPTAGDPGPVLELDIGRQEARLRVADAPEPRASVRLPEGLDLREVWVSGAPTNPLRFGVAELPFASGPVSPTYALELREDGVSRWVLVAGRTGQRTEMHTRREVEKVFDAL